jgi:imidazolonepropionase-like amidohydrolase
LFLYAAARRECARFTDNGQVKSGMKQTLLGMTASVVLLLLSACGQTGREPIVIEHVAVIDVAGGQRRPGMTVLIRDGKIAEVDSQVDTPLGAIRVEGAGKFLIPGLWDMHTHHQASGISSLDLFIAKGVVGTRDMGGDLDFILPLRDRINRDELLGPEIVAAGPILDDAPQYPFRLRVTTSDEARKTVRELKALGVDFFKVHDHTPRDAFYAVAEESARLGLPFSGHVPLGVRIDEAATSGIESIEHLSNYQVFRECSGIELYSKVGCEALFKKLAANGVWQTPTITFFQLIPSMFSGIAPDHAEYASDSLKALWESNTKGSKLAEDDLEFFGQNGRASLDAIRDLHNSGSRLLAGCDGIVPGFCLHDELEWFTKAGLSALESLQTATINPARFLNREDIQGTIDVGKSGDVVLLDGDPLADIRNVRQIAAVIVRGRLIERDEIDRTISSHLRPMQ